LKADNLLGHKLVRDDQALMQQLLTGKQRFSEFRKENWQEHRLGELFAAG